MLAARGTTSLSSHLSCWSHWMFLEQHLSIWRLIVHYQTDIVAGLGWRWENRCLVFRTLSREMWCVYTAERRRKPHFYQNQSHDLSKSWDAAISLQYNVANAQIQGKWCIHIIQFFFVNVASYRSKKLYVKRTYRIEYVNNQWINT